MKKIYSTIVIILLAFTLQAQTYEFSISLLGINSSTGNPQIALLATPSEGVTDHSTDDLGAGFYVPEGVTLGNFVTGNSGLPASEWESISLSNTTDAYFLSRVEAGANSILLNGSGPFELVIFDIIATSTLASNAMITFVENGDPIFNELLFIENYINIAAVNRFSQNDPAANSITLGTLSTATIHSGIKDISFYPNPVKSNVTIVLLNHASYTILDINGRLVQKGELLEGNNLLNLSTLANGLYVLKLSIDNQTFIKKIIKE
ncbi:T9SS type A sorting domain-containing protein [Lacinutrix himadriensis]|uniref:T9SS type A sorting domain-containing protein n=1 Tax=Lacinutrix himadriensis TaxID=641549 RepID=UPI0006E463D4|nr:T9SS type A sorting domain-containing protein [Lacinutrix himadriensis]